ncbi:hypothetical protein CerSpe_269560 [Prunus speciosa]
MRKEKAVHKTTTTDNKSLQSTIKRIGRERYPFNQVNIFMDDVVIQFINPRELQDILSSILSATWGQITWTI